MPDKTTRIPPSRIPWWLWLNVLSLDAPLLALLWQAALARVHRVTLPPGCYVALGLAVWVVYTLDRILDGLGEGRSGMFPVRHAFYQRHLRLFGYVLIPAAVSLALACALFVIPAGLMWRGVELGFIVAMYLLHYSARNHRRLFVGGNLLTCLAGFVLLVWLPLPTPFRMLLGAMLLTMLFRSFKREARPGTRMIPKELVCGFVFAMGCSSAVNYYSLDLQSGPFMAMETLVLALLWTLSRIGIASYEKAQAPTGNSNERARSWPRLARLHPFLLGTLILVAGYSLVRGQPPEMSLYLTSVLASAGMLGVLHLRSRRLSPEMNHVLAHAALITPVILLAAR